ncbi:MAG TPA: barstar family protein [Micromonosporaceae bacterium]
MMLADLTSGALPPGRYRLSESVTVRALRDELAAADWLMRVVDGGTMTDRASMFEEFAVACDFPSWFGGNWDAFADCLRDLSWLPQQPLVILWQRAGVFESRSPRMWEMANTVIGSAIADRVEADLPSLYLLFPMDTTGRSDPGDGIL